METFADIFDGNPFSQQINSKDTMSMMEQTCMSPPRKENSKYTTHRLIKSYQVLSLQNV